MRDWINEGAEPDDTPSGRCYGPAYPDAPGCGRFARSGMCARCKADTDAYWAIHMTDEPRPSTDGVALIRCDSEDLPF